MWFNFSKMFSRLVGSNFKIISKKCVFVVILLNIYLFFNSRNAILMTLHAFSSLLTTLSQFDIPICMCQYQSWFKVNQRWIGTVQSWKHSVSELRNKKISAEWRWFRADYLWRSADERWTFQFWTALIWFFMFSESALKNVKSVKEGTSALIISGTSIRVLIAQGELFFSSFSSCILFATAKGFEIYKFLLCFVCFFFDKKLGIIHFFGLLNVLLGNFIHSETPGSIPCISLSAAWKCEKFYFSGFVFCCCLFIKL